jgi:PAS domain S-box-containing protein
MRINKRLQINVAVSVLTAVVICLVLFLSLYRLNKANYSGKIAGDIIAGTLERVTLGNDYMRNNSARAKIQWFARQEQISGLLKKGLENFQDAEDRKNIAGLIEDHEASGRIFAAIVANREKSGLNPGSAVLSREVEDRLISQLNMRVYEETMHSRKMLESARKARNSALRLVATGVVSALVILIAVAMINAWTMGRAITARAARLREGAAVIGNGDLEHRIDVKGDDEFTEIAEAFNAMTAKLRCTYRDLENEVDERKQAEAALRESEERHQLATVVAKEAIWDLNISTGLVQWNRAYTEMLGRPEEAIHHNQWWLEKIHPEDRELVTSSFARALTEGKDSWVCEYRMRVPDGSYAYLADRAIIVRNKEGVPLRTVGAKLNVTEQRLAEEALRESEERLQLFIEHAPAALAMFDNEMRYLSVSRRWLSDYTLGDRDLRGLSHYAVFPEVPEHWKEIHRRALAGEIVRENNDRFDRADGSVQWLRWEVRPWYNAAGDVAGIVVFSENVTEQRRAEEALTKRTADLEAANRELEAFAYSVSHDLRAPLRSINGFSQTLQEDYSDKLDAEGKDSLERIVAATWRMGQLIDDLLNLSRMTRIEMTYGKVNLSENARKIAGKLKDAEPQRLVEFTIAEDLVAYGDERLLRVALENLLGNAWKFTGKLPRTEIEFGASMLDGRAAYFVRDNGAGFDMAYADKLFNPFQRLHSVSQFPGTGIGLATVKRIVNRHGGQVRAEGESGKGATIYFTLEAGC